MRISDWSSDVCSSDLIGILTSVNCSATVARYIAEAFNKTGILADYPNIDGVAAFVHATGCGMADSGDGYEALQRTLWGYARHRSEEHTSELQSLMRISYAVFCLKKKKRSKRDNNTQYPK